MATKDAAKEAVMGIAKEYGFIQPSSLDEIGRIDPALRREVEESMLAKDKKIGHSIITLAKHIYSSNARFVFELLQNADDNQFGRALARNELPFIAFHAFSDRIVVECNEDGFTKENLSAICSVGESTKAASHGYIGAKGIGFKSVFIAARKVEIQSGNYTFYFKHDRADLGLGMVLPVWQDVGDSIPDSLTRITLHLHQRGDPDEIQHLHQTIFRQLNDLEETCLLFLRNLKEIRVSFYNGDAKFQESKRFYLKGDSSWKVSLNKESVEKDGKESVQFRDYYVSRYMGNGLPKSENRELPATAEAQRASAQAETVLAFPATQDNCPILEPQSVFAFLPIRKTTFKFLIQSDFDTNASLQDVSLTSRRNAHLLDHVASAFCQAVLGFTSDKDFSYKWPAYLPSLEEAAGTFWADLPSKILEQLSQHAVIRTRHNRLQPIADVVIPTPDFKDSDGNVLLDHPDIDPFISDHYSSNDRNYLTPYGLGRLTIGIVLSLLRKDLNSPLSRMKSTDLSEDIHSRMAKLLARFASSSQTLRSLDLLPLQNGTWISPNSGPVFFPTTKEIPIPPGLGFRILDSSVTTNEDRHAFFSKMGVNEIEVHTVREAALQRNSMFGNPSLFESKEHLVFLYQTDQFRTGGEKNKTMRIFSEDGLLRSATFQDCYIPSNKAYGPKLLLGATDSLPGMAVPFVHSIYLDETPEAPNASHSSWIQWLQTSTGVRKNLRLIAKDGRSLSSAWDYLSKYRPQKLLGFLRHVWADEGRFVIESESLRQALRETDASRLCDVDLPGECRLHEAYLPFPNLIHQCAQFIDNEAVLPFLHLEGDSTVEQLSSNWLFLHTALGVKKDEDLDFLLDILKWLKTSNPDASDISVFRHIFSLYSAIHAKLVGTRIKVELSERIRSFFQSDDYIFVPQFDEAGVSSALWTNLELCLWRAPLNLISKYPIEPIYQNFVADETEMSYISTLFTQTLEINSASWSDLTIELAELRESETQNLTSILDVYKNIHQMNIFGFVEDLRREFRENPLIFVTSNSQNGRYKSSECLWSSTTEIRGRVTLNDDYDELKEFFIDTLGVQTLTLQMAYDDLLEAGSEATMDDIISKIWCLNALLSTDETYVDPKPLLQKQIFPVLYPDGSKALRSTDTRFAIADREYLASRFRGKIKMLDFTQAEVRSLKVFFDWANLSHCYLSASVRELTSISGDTTPFNPSPTRDLKLKAYAMLRVAGTFQSPRYHADRLGLYRLLRTANIEVADNIVTLLRIAQGGRTVDVEETVAKLHFSEQASILSIYLPRDKKAQELCYCDLLPRKLVDWLTRDPVTQILEPIDADMVKVMMMICNIHPSAAYLILDREGVAEIDIPNEDIEVDDEIHSEASYSSETSSNGDLGQFTSADTSIPIQNVQDQTRLTARQTSTSFNPPSSDYDRPVPISLVNSHSPEDDMQYRHLLDHVIQSARGTLFPSNGAFNMSQLNRALPGNEENGQYEGFDGPGLRNAFRSNSQFERDKKAFELLGRIDPSLTDWSDRNWQSTIRHYVTIHPDYATMARWYGRETADIVYEDTEGAFTSLLINHGYLEADEWEDKRPKYFIEVKTTTGPLGTPFYMSKRQFERMGAMHARSDHSEVYLIFRAFDIRGPNIGMRVYFDPEQLRLDGELLFTGETWSVIPG
ncbi:hypothetical protein N7472_008927 [Penicillium cf. griseofulvum]|uniref:Protein NO VEIN C-terminal domain-containing protein n=1 Tax=Penicillium cf. griseofulvum TaxID=2972120 RepID=A0A9W9J3G4_9EURO|nr:hypothetical protein N7472_008927 [Penicillium cf. griseofulvum]